MDFVHIIIHTLKHAVMITSFVMIMMLVIEYINVQTRGMWSEKLRQKPGLQIIISALLGIIPGCLGTFTAISLYSHNILRFGALVTALIATSGDEAFFMFAMIPEKALLISAILFVVAILAGYIVNALYKKRFKLNYKFELHEEHTKCTCFNLRETIHHLKNMSFERFLLILGFILFAILLLSGSIGMEAWDWKKFTFLSGIIIVLFIVSTVPDHFLKEHLWNHIIKVHLFRVFAWIVFALLIISIIEQYLDIEELISSNLIIVLAIAILVGLIPESGPHMIFITLFAGGMLPISILLANSIVQDGHGALPLLADSKKSFVVAKLINMVFGLIVGGMGLILQF